MMRAKARKTDPISSHIAAEKVEMLGRAKRDREIAYDAVQRMPGQTAAEYEMILKKPRYSIARRLTELRQAGFILNGKIRECRITGNKSLTWIPLEGRSE